VGHHKYEDIGIAAAVERLAAHPSAPASSQAASPVSVPEWERQDDPSPESLRIGDVIAFLRGHDLSGFDVTADVGEAWFVGLELRAEIFLAPGYYATMGFAVPAGLGAGLADRARRPLILVGDGAFQMTGNEVATLVDAEIPAIILLLNNASYVMLEALDQPRPYYQRRSWDYLAWAESMGAHGRRCVSRAELEAAFAEALSSDSVFLIEAIVAKDDYSPVMRRIRDHFHS
jgi:indolepyruvate decarboxylase